VCRACGSATLVEGAVTPGPYYEDYFPEAVREPSAVLRRRYEAILAGLERRVHGRRLLEVGFGAGHFLDVAASRGWITAGVELSRAQAEPARARGHRVRCGDLVANDLFGGERFDVAVAIEVLEHVEAPAALLTAIFARLHAGGMLYLTTPNFDGLSRRVLGGWWSVLGDEHLMLASAAGLRTALRRAGFTRVRVRSRNVNPVELVRGWRARRRFGGAPPPPPGAPEAPAAAGCSAADRVQASTAVRDRIEASRVLTAAKHAANLVLGALDLGDALVARARRP